MLTADQRLQTQLALIAPATAKQLVKEKEKEKEKDSIGAKRNRTRNHVEICHP